jgi:hypothetical protein
LLRAAAVGGAGYYAGKKIKEGRDADAAQDEFDEEQEQTPPAGGISDDVIDQLTKLADLKEKGILTEEEFEAQKQKLLAS